MTYKTIERPTYGKAGMFGERESVTAALKYANDLIHAEYRGHSTGSGSSTAALTAMYVVYNTMARKLNEAEAALKQ
mgnify:CR=1 FL=1